MKSLFEPVRFAARLGFVITAWMLVALVFVQVFYAGAAILVNPGDWSAHTNLGHRMGLPVMAMFPLSIIGWMPLRFASLSLGLYVLYILQYLFIHWPTQELAVVRALHPVNALVILAAATLLAVDSWRLLRQNSSRRTVLGAIAAICALGLTVWAGMSSRLFAADGGGGAKAASLVDATEASIPATYTTMQNPIAPGDAATIAAGRRIAEQRCITCHAADFRGRQLGNVRSADLTQSATTRSEQFLMWAISEGSRRGMPAWRSELSEEERWQLVTFIGSLKP